ncbi:MAG: hypothetical protein COB67_04550 [SAR324 cluster bacterium]|uniref:Uncharacterized protein n=1 Tax=SAR324 cluster bacterium TaxID=2024889 RepID=A0A2A4T8D5_9DELT|nr:MAG: hypothetical protein COB67_04550 [SAR324 cluster bacterium]
MSEQELISYGIAAVGGLMALGATYQLLRKGFIIWVLLLIIGVTGVNWGLSQKGDLDSFLEELSPGNLTRFSSEKLKEACENISSQLK